jgi:hypothetical protein
VPWLQCDSRSETDEYRAALSVPGSYAVRNAESWAGTQELVVLYRESRQILAPEDAMAPFKPKPNEQWLDVIDDLLGDERGKQTAARTTLWLELENHVKHFARLPLGALADDDEVRADVFVRVMMKLEANDYAHICEWRRRQRARHDQASWWGFVSLVANHRSIEYVRTSKRNMAARGSPCEWARIELADPSVFEDTLSDSEGFLAHGSEQALYDYLDRFQSSQWSAELEPSAALPPFMETSRSRRARS